jgi:hypothetical protein
MSTKIYTGIRFTTATEADALACLDSLRTAMTAQVRTEVAMLMARWVAASLDQAATGLVDEDAESLDLDLAAGLTDPTTPTATGTTGAARAATPPHGAAGPLRGPTSPYGAAWVRFTERMKEIERTRRRDPEVDFECTIRVMPTPHGVLGIYDTERTALEDLILAHPQIEAYGYWDNTDPDENVSEADWATRETAWEWVIEHWGGTGSVAELGTRVTLSDRLTATLAVPTPDEVAAQMPTVAHRTRRLAQTRALEEAVADSGASVTAHTAMGLYRDALKGPKTPEGQERLASHEAWVKERLVPAITTAHILEGLTPATGPAIAPPVETRGRAAPRPSSRRR